MSKLDYSGDFVVKRYGVVQGVDTETSIERIIGDLFKEGQVLHVTMQVETTGQEVKFCNAPVKYGRCDAELNSDGTCPKAEGHKKEGEE